MAQQNKPGPTAAVARGRLRSETGACYAISFNCAGENITRPRLSTSVGLIAGPLECIPSWIRAETFKLRLRFFLTD